MVRIRMTRTGRKNKPFWRIGVYPGTTRRDGPTLEYLGNYDPRAQDPTKKVVLDKARYEHWVSKGARPTDALARILKAAGVV